MIKKILVLSAAVFLIVGLHAITPVSAQSSGNLTPEKQSGNLTPEKKCTGTACPTTNSNAQGTGFNLNIKLNNPLKVNTIQDAIKLFVNAIVRLAIPVIVIFFLWSGLMFIFARGNPEKIKQAKNMFFYTIIGTLLILGAWTITNAIIGTVNSITS
ncbi:MAG TPA: pilin [Candidatus Paceibacterota bacterium]